MIQIYDLINEGLGAVQITVTANDLLTFANQIIAGVQNNLHPVIKEEEEKMFTRKQIMDRYKVGGTTLHNWKKRGWLIPVKIGRKAYYRESDISALLKGEEKEKV